MLKNLHILKRRRFFWRGVFIFQYSYAVFGDDLRQTFLLRELAKEYSCLLFQEGAALEEVCKAQNILLPIPMTKGTRLNLQGDAAVTPEELLDCLVAGQRIFAGCMDEAWKRAAEEKGAVCYDYMKEETIAVYNSIATAEGTIAEIIRTYPKNLHGEKVLLLGFGRCAGALADRLKALHANVSVAARAEHARMEAYACGCHAIDLKELAAVIGEYPVIVNTVPSRILKERELSLVSDEAVIYEIASFPYGVDIEEAKRLKKRVVLCPSLPARYAPASSAEMIRKYIMERQEET